MRKKRPVCVVAAPLPSRLAPVAVAFDFVSFTAQFLVFCVSPLGLSCVVEVRTQAWVYVCACVCSVCAETRTWCVIL